MASSVLLFTFSVTSYLNRIIFTDTVTEKYGRSTFSWETTALVFVHRLIVLFDFLKEDCTHLQLTTNFCVSMHMILIVTCFIFLVLDLLMIVMLLLPVITVTTSSIYIPHSVITFLFVMLHKWHIFDVFKTNMTKLPTFWMPPLFKPPPFFAVFLHRQLHFVFNTQRLVL